LFEGYYPETTPLALHLAVFVWIGSIVVVVTFTTIYLVVLGSVFVAMGLLVALELTLRRVAEHAKGPILAISGLVGAVAALFKAIAG
jgi:hypothetical protein